MSRASIYQHFSNKEELFRALVAFHHDRSLQAAEAALNDKSLSLHEKTSELIEARVGYLNRLVWSSAHRIEARRVSIDLTSDLLHQSSKKYHSLVVGLLRSADKNGEIKLSILKLTPGIAASVLINGAQGQRYEFVSEVSLGVYKKQVRAFTKVFLSGLGYSGKLE